MSSYSYLGGFSLCGKRERRECMRKAKELRNKSRGFTGSACKVRTPVGEEAGWAYTELCSFYRDFLACGLLRVRWHRHCSPGRPQGAQVLAITAALGLGDSGGSEAWVLLGCDWGICRAEGPAPWLASSPPSAPLSRQMGLSLGFAEGFPGLPSSEPSQLTASWTEVIWTQTTDPC